MPDDGEVPRSVLRAATVPRRRLSAALVDGARIGGRIITSRLLDGDRDRRKDSTMSTVTCTCGSEIDAETRQPVGAVSTRGQGCSHGAAVKSGIRPTESKMGRAVETK